MKTKTKIRARNDGTHYKTTILLRDHQFVADEPVDNGGQNTGPSPTEFVLTGLASCAAMTVRMYADRKEWPLEAVEVEVGHQIEKTEDGQVTHIFTELHFEGPLSPEQQDRLREIARKCPVFRLLTHPIHIDADVV